jgi:sugar phosphate permease
VLHRQKALSTISGVSDGVAGFGSIAGQVLLGPVQENFGWKSCFAMYSLAAILACFPALPYTIKEIIKGFRAKRLKKAATQYME